MNKKSLYMLAVFDEKTQQKLTDYRRILIERGFVGSQTQGIPHHLTLGQFDVNDEARVRERMTAVCRDIAAFPICLGHIGMFGSRVLFIGPHINPQLLTLHSAFFAGGTDGAHDWCAHATMLIEEDGGNIFGALPVLTECFKPMRAHIDRLALYEFFPPRLVQTLPLVHTES